MHLSESQFLGQGSTKTVYTHPSDPLLCIKFPRTDHKARGKADILREIKYLQKHQDRLPFLSKYYDTIETNLGTGYLYQRALNADGSPAMAMPHFLKTKPDRELLYQKVADIYQQLIKTHAIASDLQPLNFFTPFDKNGDYFLFLVDGFGNSDFVKICDYSKFFFRRKLARKFTKLTKQLKIPDDFILP